MDNLHIYIKYIPIYIKKKNTQVYMYTHTHPFAQNKDHICS